MTVAVSRAQVLAFRWHAQQLDRRPGTASDAADCAVLDLGIQNTGPDGAAWALRVRGAPADTSNVLALAWTLRAAPHCYRRADLPAVAVATAPFSDADAGKRIFDANRPLKAAGIPASDALRAVAAEMRDIVREPTGKGAMSAALAARMGEPYLRLCRPCNATHLYEMPFRLAALHAGLELRPNTSPPVLERIPGWEFAPYTDGERDPRLDPIRGYLRFFGPATPKIVAAYLDAPVKDVKAHWPGDVTDVSIDGEAASILTADVDALLDPPADTSVRLLGPFDPYLQLKDRELLVPDEASRKDLWRPLGRPGAVAVGDEIVGSWRPRTSGRKFTVEVTPWQNLTAKVRTGVDEQAQELADFRGVTLTGVTTAE
ncbi:winged helix DNA-binding domain-containing protein [Prescottella sp. R16]|uniref:winged helix DNA-binding domain-containing protein n=1 Tax=Prescottella sp. R16 TaxID=3064529 RepID=UPI00272DCF04|nr:winged helix DNA-binding domain-containing protein [Prescottella sp. R16]